MNELIKYFQRNPCVSWIDLPSWVNHREMNQAIDDGYIRSELETESYVLTAKGFDLA